MRLTLAATCGSLAVALCIAIIALEGRSQAISTVVTWVLSRAEGVFLGPGPSSSDVRFTALLVQLAIVFATIGVLAHVFMGRMNGKSLTRLALFLSPSAPWVSQVLLQV